MGRGSRGFVCLEALGSLPPPSKPLEPFQTVTPRAAA
jgi:hypothetical protein